MSVEQEASVMQETNALNLSWAFGFNKDIIQGVHNLSDANRHAIFYIAAHTGVIYDYATRQQLLLQGHTNSIRCCAVSEDKKWIVTADTGKDSMIVIWDSFSGNPIRTIFNPHENGVAAIDISPDAMFLATLSHVAGAKKKEKGEKRGNETPQELSVWEWTGKSEGALHSMQLTASDVQHCIRFNPSDIRDILTNGKRRVIFWNWSSGNLQFYSPPISPKDFKQGMAAFTQSIFIPDTTQAITGTMDGNVLLWDTLPLFSKASASSSSSAATVGKEILPDRQAIKLVPVGSDGHRHAPVLVLHEVEGYLVVGTQEGTVQFFDYEFRLVAWFEHLKAGPITSISFAASVARLRHERDEPQLQQQQPARAFKVPDFIVGTKKAFVVGVNPDLFHQVDSEQQRGTLLVQGIDDSISSIAAHPHASYLAIAVYSGTIQLWDYDSKRLMMMKRFDADKFRPQSIAFMPNGRYLVAGFTSGALKILRAHTLEDLATLKIVKGSITDVRISLDSQFIATADTEFHISLWANNGAEENDRPTDTAEASSSSIDKDLSKQWVYIGRCQSHAAPITGLEFSVSPDGCPLLVSVSEDRTLVEYNLSSSSIATGILLSSPPIQIEQEGIPTACAWHPPPPPPSPPSPFTSSTTHQFVEDLIVVANDQYKLKQWNTESKACRKTTLGPTYGGPINRIINVPSRSNNAIGSVDDPPQDQQEHDLKATAGQERKTTGHQHQQNQHQPHQHQYQHQHRQYAVYTTGEKVMGLLTFPLTGHPAEATGVVAHPAAIAGAAVAGDGRWVFTAGGRSSPAAREAKAKAKEAKAEGEEAKEAEEAEGEGAVAVVNQWRLDLNIPPPPSPVVHEGEEAVEAVEVASAGGGVDVTPFLALLPGGPAGALYQDLVEYFYYAQLRGGSGGGGGGGSGGGGSQGSETETTTTTTTTTCTRVPQASSCSSANAKGGVVSIQELPGLMRALGFYPTEWEIQHMIGEATYARFNETKERQHEIGFDDFVKLYINHRPVFGIGKQQIDMAFQALGAHPDVSWEALKASLEQLGEKMTSKELKACMDALVGNESVPPRLNATLFAEQLLGFEDYDAESVEQEE